MNVYESVNAILTSVGKPFYHGMPEFDEDEPEDYITYNIHGKPENYASGNAGSQCCWVALSVFTPLVDTQLYEQIIGAFTEQGYTVQSFGDVSTIGGYPFRKQYSIDLIINYDVTA